MRYEIRDGWVIFVDGTRIPAISGAQDEASFSPDFYLTVGAADEGPIAIAPESDIPGQIGAGVPYGDPAAVGNVSLADIIRSGGDPATAVPGTSSLSDMIRSGTGGAPFDASTYNPNVPTGDQAGSINVMDVVKTVAGLGAGIASIFVGRGGTSNPASRYSSTNGTQSLAQRIFGLTPSRAGTTPNTGIMGLLLVTLAAIGVMILFRSRA